MTTVSAPPLEVGEQYWAYADTVMWFVTSEPYARWSIKRVEKGVEDYTIAPIRAAEVADYLLHWGASDVLEWYRYSTMREPERDPGTVYVAGAPDAYRLVKIGYTSGTVDRRLNQIRTMSPVPIRELWSTPGTLQTEGALHATFAAQRVHGEWFDFGDADPVATIREHVEAQS